MKKLNEKNVVMELKSYGLIGNKEALFEKILGYDLIKHIGDVQVCFNDSINIELQ